jgi:hypothetical protein
MSTIYE